MSALRHRLQPRHDTGERQGITSVCSAHPLVIEAAVAQAVGDDALLLVEATSNQVDQFGGYTGMRPGDFRDLVHRTAERHGLERGRVVLGGDHLGPNTWRAEGAQAAMVKAEDLVVAYVRAGFAKIHLDCSMVCAGDREPLGDAIVAERAARLARAAEGAARRAGLGGQIGYVIGTEVPVPGGAHESIEALTPTSAGAARATLAAHREAPRRAAPRSGPLVAAAHLALREPHRAGELAHRDASVARGPHRLVEAPLGGEQRGFALIPSAVLVHRSIVPWMGQARFDSERCPEPPPSPPAASA